MTGDTLLKAADALDAYLSTYDDLFGRRENREHFRQFARGQMGPIERKSLEPMADLERTSPRTLQLFFSKAKWDEDSVRDKLHGDVREKYGGSDGIFVIDPTSDAKKGEMTAGVARQYCGESGKIDNCIVTVHLGYTRGNFHGLLDGDLFLPKSWDANTGDPEIERKRRLAGIPPDVGYRSKCDLSLDQLDRARKNGVPGRFVTADEDFGGKPWWRGAVHGLGFRYVVEVPRSTRGLMQEPKQEDIEKDALKVEKLLIDPAGLRFTTWEAFRVHDTQKGPEVWEFKAGPFWEKLRRQEGYDGVKWLLVGRNVRTREVKYFLSDAPPGTPIEVLIRVAFSRWIIERCFQDCKTELGFNHAEVRKYRAIHRHLILTAVNYFFIQDWNLRHRRGEKPGPDREPVRGRDSEAA